MSVVPAMDISPSSADDDQPCPVETAVGVIGGKWKVLILWHLQERGTLRFAELERALEGVSPKVLSQQLRDLERDGMLSRTVFPEVPPRVEYALTELGRSLGGPLQSLCAWGEHFLRVRAAGDLPPGLRGAAHASPHGMQGGAAVQP